LLKTSLIGESTLVKELAKSGEKKGNIPKETINTKSNIVIGTFQSTIS